MAPSTPRSSISNEFGTPLTHMEDVEEIISQSLVDSDLADDNTENGKLSPCPASKHAIPEDLGPMASISRLLQGKEKEWTAVVEKQGPLNLLDLPVDILREIIHHLPHTNDLTSLALTHSALHALTIPQIYARFDIVWPDETSNAETRSGVDALTYGLATLVMAHELFQDLPSHSGPAFADRSSNLIRPTSSRYGSYPIVKRRRGNYYAQFTKKFSLGNGPPEFVQEYLITKEGGKMLGTLVAIAIARMRNLETFVWDMPTGVLRDIWMALSSLADDDSRECPLERLWIRWHDNRPEGTRQAIPPPPPTMGLGNGIPPPPIVGNQSINTITPGVHSADPISVDRLQAVDRVEHPTFSVIPSLKSLSVLDIDELPYLDEMSVLIARSAKKLRELRVGIARHAQSLDWVTAWEGDGISQVDHSTTDTAECGISNKRLGGVLGVLVGRVYNMRRNSVTVTRALSAQITEHAPGVPTSNALAVPNSSPTAAATAAGADRETELEQHADDTPLAHSDAEHDSSLTEKGDTIVTATLHQEAPQDTDLSSIEISNLQITEQVQDKPRPRLQHSKPSTKPLVEDRERTEEFLTRRFGPELCSKLRLDMLELERVPLSVSVMLKAFDWTMLTTLTLLHCPNHETLWKSLRRTYSPRPPHHAVAGNSKSSKSSSKLEYRLSLKKIHTNAVSSSLISFVKETLAPNSLEVLFLQEGRGYQTAVTIDQIYRGPLRRHRGSLRKLLIDSGERGLDGTPTMNMRWRKWMVNREIITFITSGKMANLRELAITIDYKDWHFFLQRLPLVPHIRSLYIPHIADHAHGNNIDPRELALQIVDIVHLRPDIEICYMGLASKCFEILENRPSHDQRSNNPTAGADGGSGVSQNAAQGYFEMDASDEDEGESEEDDEDDEMDAEEDGMDGEAVDTTESEEDTFDEEDSEDDGEGHGFEEVRSKLRLREILFYDDKVAIFRARHGRL